jgi:hypothetical protein
MLVCGAEFLSGDDMHPPFLLGITGSLYSGTARQQELGGQPFRFDFSAVVHFIKIISTVLQLSNLPLIVHTAKCR